MENKIMVSVVCTAYNHGPYIREALESFVNQKTDFEYEVLVNDDCSTDDTADIIREFAEKYPERIIPFIQEKNLYSQGINIYNHVFYPVARGKYIALCEGDDYWTDPMKLQLQVDFLESHPEYTACVHNTMIHYCDASQPDRPYVPAEGDRDIPFEQVIQGMGVSYHTSSIIARRENIIDTTDYRDVAYRHGFTDYAIGIRFSLEGKVRFLERFMSVYRVASNPAAWSSGVNNHYRGLKRFVVGEIEMFKTLLPHLDEEKAALVKQVLLEREYELFYITGQVREMTKPPYLEIHRKKDLKFRFKHWLKCNIPFLHRIYRKKMGYGD